jgi:uncharacterized membrane protein HdeD (DUF308 family)
MARLDDFLQPLEEGVWEVIIDKEEVTEPLEGWSKSSFNLPTPGVIASYRKGQYHVHETKYEWRVHKDRYDPEEKPFMHLVDDAPLVFLLGGTFNALLFDTKSSLTKDPMQFLEEYKVAWQLLLITGIALIVVGAYIGLDPLRIFLRTIEYAIPIIILAFAALLVYNGLRVRPLGKATLKRISFGLGLAILGFFTIFFDLIWILTIFILIIAIWGFMSAFVSIKRTVKGRLATPEGFYRRLGLGIFSLALAILVIFSPAFVVAALMYIIAIVIMLIGLLMIIDSFGIRTAMKQLRTGIELHEGFGKVD